MVRKIMIAMVVSACSLLVACHMSQRVKGNGNQKSETRSLENFTDVVAEGHYIITVKKKQPSSITLSVDSNLLSLITTEIRGQTLYIYPKSGKSFSPTITPTLLVNTAELKQLILNGAMKATVNDIDAVTFTLKANGSSDAKMSGKTNQLNINISGAGRIDAQHLVAKNATVDASGSSYISVNVNDKLSINSYGSSRFMVYGDPNQVVENIQGSGWVTRAKK